jgi:hypothetical protein
MRIHHLLPFRQRDNEKELVVVSLLILWIKSLWTLHPDAQLSFDKVPVHHLFPYAEDVLISYPTYFFYFCDKTSWLMVTAIWYRVFENYRPVFTILFVIQSFQFIEYAINYNKAWFTVEAFGHDLEVDFTLLKLTIPFFVFIHYTTWKKPLQ